MKFWVIEILTLGHLLSKEICATKNFRDGWILYSGTHFHPPPHIDSRQHLHVSRGRVVVKYKTGNPGYEGSILLKFLIFFVFWTATHVLSNKTLGCTQFQQVSQLHPWWCKCQIKHQLRRKWITVYVSFEITCVLITIVSLSFTLGQKHDINIVIILLSILGSGALIK